MIIAVLALKQDYFFQAILAALEPPEPVKRRKCCLLWLVWILRPNDNDCQQILMFGRESAAAFGQNLNLSRVKFKLKQKCKLNYIFKFLLLIEYKVLNWNAFYKWD